MYIKEKEKKNRKMRKRRHHGIGIGHRRVRFEKHELTLECSIHTITTITDTCSNLFSLLAFFFFLYIYIK